MRPVETQGVDVEDVDIDIEEVVSRILPPDGGEGAREAARRRQERLTKPRGSLGELEELSVRVAGVLDTDRPVLRGKTLIVAAADHGVVAERVSGYPQEVTAQMVSNFLSGGAAVNVMARRVGVELVIVDAGMATPPPANRDIRVVGASRGTGNIARGPAMSRREAEACVRAGMRLAIESAGSGADLIGTGDMGIGNTTAASTITSALTGVPAAETTGRGTGRSDEELVSKVAVVERALAVNRPDPDDGLDVLAKVGGFEIGVLGGVVLGAAASRRVVVLDGFVSGAAALVACSIGPAARDYLVAGHRSAEAGHRIVLDHLGLRPLLDLDLRLGEGTGAVLAMGLVEAAVGCLSEMATFSEAGVSDSMSGRSHEPTT